MSDGSAGTLSGGATAPAPSVRLLRWLAPALLLMLAWRLFFTVYHTYTPLGPSIVPAAAATEPIRGDWAEIGPWFKEGSVSMVEGAGGALHFVLAATGSVHGTAGFTIRACDPRVKAFRVSARVRCDGVVRGQAPYQTARIMLFHRDGSGRARWDWNHEVATLQGSPSWHRVTTVLPVPDFSRGAELRLSQMGGRGMMEVSDLSLEPMRMTAGHGWVFSLGVAVWGLAVLAYAVRLRVLRRRHGWGVLAAVLAIAVGMLLPEGAIDRTEDVVATAVSRMAPRVTIPPRVPAVTNAVAVVRGTNGAVAAASVRPPVRVAPSLASRFGHWMQRFRPAQGAADLYRRLDLHAPGHIVVFAWLGISAVLCFVPAGVDGLRRRRAWPPILAGLVVFAYAAEQLQWLTLTRHASFRDATINLAGLALGLLMIEGWRRLRGRGQPPDPEASAPHA